jgi:hypothetical protein
MKRYLAALIIPFSVLLLFGWAVARFAYGAIESGEYQVAKAPLNIIGTCNLGDLDVLGDSTVSADLFPSRIGPGVRDLGFAALTPVESYFTVQSILKCPQRPESVAFSFAPSEFGFNPLYPASVKTFFWLRSFAYGVIDYQDAMDVLKYSKAFNDPLYTGASSLFDIDYRLKSFCYATRFPPYFLPRFRFYLSLLVKGQVPRFEALNREIYDQTITENGHHFYGMDPQGGAVLDHDADRTDDGISPMTDFYFRRAIEALTQNGIQVFLIEPPRNETSAAHYPPGLVDIYQNYLLDLQWASPDVHLIGNGLAVWKPELFGDESHLNVRGAMIYSDIMRRMLAVADPALVTYGDTQLTTRNLYGAGTPSAAFWSKPATENADRIAPGDTDLPKLNAASGNPAWLYQADPPEGTTGWHNLQAPAVKLDTGSYFAASILIKNVNADQAALQVKWPDGTQGKIIWDFSQQQSRYAGTANKVNSGVLFCPTGWVELFLSQKTGPAVGSPAIPTISLAASHTASAYLYNMTLERSMWPTNYCVLQPGEAKTIPLPAIASSE